MSSESITPISAHSPAHSGDANDHEALEQLDRELLVAERVRDYSDEIYMYTRQQWIDWKGQVDRQRSAAAASHHSNHHHNHRNPTGHAHASGGGNGGNKRAHGHGKHAIEGPAMTHGAGGHGGAVKARQEPFNFYAPTSPVSELVRSQSDGSD